MPHALSILNFSKAPDTLFLPGCFGQTITPQFARLLISLVASRVHCRAMTVWSSRYFKIEVDKGFGKQVLTSVRRFANSLVNAVNLLKPSIW